MVAYAQGRCPDCGRKIAGRADGIAAAHGDRRLVALAPHTRTRQGHGRDAACLTMGARRVVPRTWD